MKKLLAFSACSALLGAGSFALAGNFEQPNNHFNNQNITGGAYIGGSIGIGGMNTPKLNAADHNLTSTSSKLRKGVAYRADLGYLFAVAPQLLLGGEFGYTGYPNNKYTGNNVNGYTENLKYKGHMFDLLGVAKYYFGCNFNVFGKAGAAYVYQKATITVSHRARTVPVFSESKNKILPELAAGIGYDFTPAIGANITYSHVFGSKPSFQDLSTFNNVASVNTVLAGLTYKFSM